MTTSSGEDEDDDDGLLNKITDRQGRKQLEMDMHHRLRAYNDMLSQDLKGMPEVKIDNIVQNKFRRVNWFARSENESIISRNENDDDDGNGNAQGGPFVGLDIFFPGKLSPGKRNQGVGGLVVTN